MVWRALQHRRRQRLWHVQRNIFKAVGGVCWGQAARRRHARCMAAGKGLAGLNGRQRSARCALLSRTGLSCAVCLRGPV